MPLTPGTRLGPYEIVATLGAGGMGEVYRARDTRLGRDVAVKVLPQHLSASIEVRARFDREAKTISSLNHPNICTLHDVGRAPGEAGSGDTDYLVMELVIGETLAHRLAKGALHVSEVLALGRQIADALDRAHRAGVIHRDLKPGNVMLTKSGAKLMDFGLARASGLGPAASGSEGAPAAMTQSPTVAAPLTAEGTIVGTFQYMAPEQLEGKEADARSDLWALGCVLYEMVTGKRAFDGRSQASLIAAIMHAEPTPASQLVPLSPLALDRVVSACLAKDPADRIQSAHDVKLQLAWIAEGTTPMSAPNAPALPARRRKPSWLQVGLVALAAVAGTAAVIGLLLSGNAAAPGKPQRYVLGMADLQPLSVPMLSPDGSFAVFSARASGGRRLFRRDLSSFDISPIPGTEDGTAPFFSPDGAWIGFATTQAIKKVPVNGGLAQTVLKEPRVDAADWGRDGAIYFTPRLGGADGLTALARVPANGGRATVVAQLDSARGESEAWLPEILPDGKTVLITISGPGTASGWNIEAVRADGSRHLVVEDGQFGRYVRSGHLLYWDFDSKVVLAAPFDPVQARVTGPAAPLTEEVDDNFGFDVAEDGKLIYVPISGAGQGYEVVWLDRQGNVTPASDVKGPWSQPRVSPDGKRILLRKIAVHCELWTLDVGQDRPVPISQGPDQHDAIWSPDGRRIAYQVPNERGQIMTMAVGGAREVRRISQSGSPEIPCSWSAGGNLLAYSVTGRGTLSDIWVRPMDSTSPPAAFLATLFQESDPAFSPDGRWIAYTSNETGAAEVYVRPYPDTGTSWSISINGGGQPVWSRDGKELYYLSGSRMMAVPIETRPAFRSGRPVQLFEGGFEVASSRSFDVAPDGRFVAVRRGAGGSSQMELRMLLNWQDEMKRKAGPSH
jgi:serine/threonine protein kinase